MATMSTLCLLVFAFSAELIVFGFWFAAFHSWQARSLEPQKSLGSPAYWLKPLHIWDVPRDVHDPKGAFKRHVSFVRVLLVYVLAVVTSVVLLGTAGESDDRAVRRALFVVPTILALIGSPYVATRWAYRFQPHPIVGRRWTVGVWPTVVGLAASVSLLKLTDNGSLTSVLKRAVTGLGKEPAFIDHADYIVPILGIAFLYNMTVSRWSPAAKAISDLVKADALSIVLIDWTTYLRISFVAGAGLAVLCVLAPRIIAP